jgi:hypothetical protein
MKTNLKKNMFDEISFKSTRNFRNHNANSVHKNNLDTLKLQKLSPRDISGPHIARLQQVRSQPAFAKGAKLFKKWLVDNNKRLPNFLHNEDD